jgi:hypothetical protein
VTERELARGASITLTTPSLGVRQWRDDDSQDTTLIAWATAGGRGLPRTVIIVPVVEENRGMDARWVLPRTVVNDFAAEARRFIRRDMDHPLVRAVGDRPEDVDDPASPRVTPVPNDWGERWGTDHVMVLLVFDESPDSGDQADVATVQNLDGASAPADQEIEALREFFQNQYDARLVRRGLVRLPQLGAPTPPGELVFGLASCQYPADITDGSPSKDRNSYPPASASLLHLAELLRRRDLGPVPSLLVLAGDQVYVDATAGLLDARTQADRLRLPYQDLMRNPGAQAALGLLPVAMVIDDHEIIDNWEPGVALPKPASLDEAKCAYRRFQRMAGPRLSGGGALWCTFKYSGVPFFLADTRTERCTRDNRPRDVGNWRDARIMGATQWGALRAFLTAHRDEVSFVVSPSMLLPRDLGIRQEPSLALEADDWDAYPASRDELLAFLCENNLHRVVFLSGDAHTSSVAHAVVTRGHHCATLSSVHSSGLYCPYPFANGAEENYAGDEKFDFRAASEPDGPVRRYHCVIRVRPWRPGDGFAVLHLQGAGRGTDAMLRVRFHRAGDRCCGGLGGRPEDAVTEITVPA